MTNELIQKVASYSDEYVKENLNDKYDKHILLTNWQESLSFHFGHSFYQGRRDKISQKIEKRAKDILEKYINENNGIPEVILNKENFPEIRSRLMEGIGKGKIGRSRDIEMIISILGFISENSERNIVNYSLSRIQNGETADHFKELQKIHSIGPKCSSFYLRDLVSFYSLEPKIKKREDLVCLQPVDTWVRKVAYEVGIINKLDERDENVREKIVDACSELGVSTIEFNQGAWYLGYNSFKLLIKKLKE
ncbi:hypothetical protein EO98_19280 [Methanosarcina sp. 2.H.T.1A.6]|uniref:hypothetical protein n=1 Tax=unclassified Methanosarcina TaxID=2644672 RepID=UPI0006227853|nr:MULTISPECIES: hypothetical protein [unclassified Methanosarcina]KKG18178.1 hypothetical protein EO94_09890 [Methanosarcina sp. 2.H.T.1A.3]KKG19085.1 hypothetical protein EO97_03975 [Methanosarcina sp. 2.H.T.1A.15]KKG19401.1 hypothetical protein EO98_19280 [Methanosarcina sp. 2.H.T.1A.6]KKG25558.1 hypothetical protein EO96_18565 [Methanosarcina sp. 2.H.T.1A.8]